MAAAKFVVITNGGGCALTGTADAFFPRVAIGCRLLGGVLIGGYMISFSVNRRYGIWYYL